MLFAYGEDLVKILKSIPKKTATVYSTVIGVCKAELHKGGVALSNETANIVVDRQGKISKDGECVVFPSKDNRSWVNWKKNIVEKGVVIKSSTDNSFHIVVGNKRDEFSTRDATGDYHTVRYDYASFASSFETKDFMEKLEYNGYKWNPETKTVESNLVFLEPNSWYVCIKSDTDKGFTYDKVYQSDEKGIGIKNNDGYWICWSEHNLVQEHFKKWTISNAKKGDVLVSTKTNNPFIYKGKTDNMGNPYAYGGVRSKGTDEGFERFFYVCNEDFAFVTCQVRPADDKDIQKLMYYSQTSNYLWNKTDMKFATFCVGDYISHNGKRYKIKKLNSCFEVEPVDDPADGIRYISYGSVVVAADFDPGSLEPYTKVIVRGGAYCEWFLTFFSHYIKRENACVTTNGKMYYFCVPYNDETKHLVGTRDDYTGKYKFWHR